MLFTPISLKPMRLLGWVIRTNVPNSIGNNERIYWLEILIYDTDEEMLDFLVKPHPKSFNIMF